MKSTFGAFDFSGRPALVIGAVLGLLACAVALAACSPFNRVFALDPQTGAQRWSFDPEVDLTGRYANQLVCRGVTYWRDASAPEGAACERRIFSATNDARLFAVDAETGPACAGFGDGGKVDLNPAAGDQLWQGEYQVTSPPTVLGDRVIVGSAVSDNARTDAPSGVVLAFDARSGRELWAWDLAPPWTTTCGPSISRRERSSGGGGLPPAARPRPWRTGSGASPTW
jgi:glucose dehydrogenase